MNQLNYRHHHNSNIEIKTSRTAIQKGRSRKFWLKFRCTVLGSMFFMAGISTVIGVWDYIKRGAISEPWASLFILGAFLICSIGVGFGIKGFQR